MPRFSNTQSSSYAQEKRTMKTLISIIIPTFNEQNNIKRAYDAVVEQLSGREDLDFEIIFTDNHSTDDSFLILTGLAARDPRVKVLRFTRNFGFNKSILTGYRHASGNCAIQIDCDLEDPPEVFHDFIRLWRDGHDMVIGVRAQRTESRWICYLRRVYYAALNKVSDEPHEPNSGDFRLLDRNILDQLKLIEDPYPFIRGLVTELSYNPAKVSFCRRSRQQGESKFPFQQLIRLALEGIYAHSTLPLKLAFYVGLLISLITILLTGGYITMRLFVNNYWPAGFATTTVLILFGISLNALFLGILGEYIARIYQHVRVRPSVIIEQSVNINSVGAFYASEQMQDRQNLIDTEAK